MMKNSLDDPNYPQATSAIFNLKQHYAMELLLIGKTDLEVAQLIGVDSGTILHWRDREPDFINAMNAIREAVWEESVARLSNLLAESLDVVEAAITRGDEMVAIAFLQNLVPSTNSK